MDKIIYLILGGGIGVLIGYYLRKMAAENKVVSAESRAKKIVEEAEKEAVNKKKEILLETKDTLIKEKIELEKEFKGRRTELVVFEKRLRQKEESLDRKTDAIEKKEEDINQKLKDITKRLENLDQKDKEIKVLIEEERKKLEMISGLTVEDAKKMLLLELKDEVTHESGLMIKQIQDEAKETAEKKARDIVTLAIQRCAVDQVVDSTVSVISLPNEEMKGRIIGREGRNIRALENATGINLIVDDTPEAVILSGFDSVRREIARITLEKLISDGRIHPARIEELVEKVKKEVEATIYEEGENAVFEAGIRGIHPEEIKLLGRLKYRTSYGQNVLQHSKEVAHLAGVLASELKVDVTIAKRAGLLHDIGKAVDHDQEGTHPQLGADLAKKYNEAPVIVNAIASHHDDIPPQNIEAVLVQVADSISGSRPGARRETLENYVKRLEKLEKIADTFAGVEKAFAIQAGREVRVIVKSDIVNDTDAAILARDLAKKVEAELEYPGQIKITVIRETRVVDYAK
ncbi:MAG: ribonuclease Y [bacterium]|nr:ribonuclease Y [bacterium]